MQQLNERKMLDEARRKKLIFATYFLPYKWPGLVPVIYAYVVGLRACSYGPGMG